MRAGTKSRRDARVERLEVRASPNQAAVIRQAAAATAKTVTAFVLDAATLEASERSPTGGSFASIPIAGSGS